MRSAPQSRWFAAISLIKTIVSGESFGSLERAFDVFFQNKRKSRILRIEDEFGAFGT